MNEKQPHAILLDETHYILPEDYTYSWEMTAQDADDPTVKFPVTTKITVKKGFRWDGASIPKILWPLGFKPDGRHRAAALVHDFIYIHKGKLPGGSIVSDYQEIVNQIQHGSFSRKDADRLFGKMMDDDQVGPFKKTVMRLGVTWFGWIYWEDGGDLIRWTLIKTLLVGIFLYVSYTIVMGS